MQHIFVGCVYITSLSIVSFSVFMHKNPTAMQLAGLYLGENSLGGPLPDSWSECMSVSHGQYVLAYCSLAEP